MSELVILGTEPLNCEAPVARLLGGTAMPNEHFYVRNHFAVPAFDRERWRLQVRGLVKRPLRLTLGDLLNLPSEVMTVTLECAGNGRAFLTPAVGGEQWGLGAVGTAEWTGVPVAEVLDRVEIDSAARNVVFKGADGEGVRFERALTLEEISRSAALLAYAMNGEALPAEHGYPLRLVVPGWYGVASVKWLTEIEVIDQPFNGYFQTERYVYEVERDGRVASEPVQHQRVRAIVTQPAADEVATCGPMAIRGLAWSGVAPIARVDVSINRTSWQPARLLGDPSTHHWQRWELIGQVDQPGMATIRVRATDAMGRSQPDRPEWNRLGYGNNAIHELSIRVEPSRSMM